MIDDQTAIHLAKKKAEIAGFQTEFLADETALIARHAAGQGNLTLVCGAGASSALRLPVWDSLVNQLYEDIYSAIGIPIDLSFIASLRARGYSSAILVRHLEYLAGYPSSVRATLRDRLYATLWE